MIKQLEKTSNKVNNELNKPKKIIVNNRPLTCSKITKKEIMQDGFSYSVSVYLKDGKIYFG